MPCKEGAGSPLSSFATPVPFLSCSLPYFNSRHKIPHSAENFMKIEPKLIKKGKKKKRNQYLKVSLFIFLFEAFIVEWDYIL